MSYQRAEKAIIQKRAQGEPWRFIQVIYGPRQVGKTVLVCQVIKDTNASNTFVAADAIPAGDRIWIAQQWENTRSIQNRNLEISHILIIYEVQKIDNWSEQVKAEWDRDTTEDLDIRVI